PDDEGVCLISRDCKTLRCYKTGNTVPSVGSSLPYVNGGPFFSHNIALAHARYAIIDLSDGGHQPFVSMDGSIAAVFNGEIYNYIELKEELSLLGVVFRTSSDTEVLVEGYRVWKQELWRKMNGFWAVAIFDFRDDSFVLSRDRIGVAPLYYRDMPGGVFFSSCIQPLVNIPPKNMAPDSDVAAGFIQTGIKDHDNTTFYSEIKSVPSASTVTFKSGCYAYENAYTASFWGLPEKRMTIRDISFDEAVEKYREVFFDAVKLRLRSDVKVAFELSGGLDSSSVVAAAALQRRSDITTYTVKIKGADEEPFARSLLTRYPVDYRVVSDIEDHFAGDCGAFSAMMEEPYDNPNDYSHYKMLEIMKRQGVYVVVTGAGGDEVLAGYEASFWPKAYSEMRGEGVRSFLRADWYEFCRRFKTLKSSYDILRHYVCGPFKLLAKRSASCEHPDSGLKITRALECSRKYRDLSFNEQVKYHFKVALIPYYMRSSDHFTMGLPIEHRFPLLDYRVVELGVSMPVLYLFRNGWTKYLLRKAMEPYLPAKIIWRRKKMGFTFPYGSYFARHRSFFKPLLSYLKAMDLSVADYGDYDRMLKTDPVLLWRVLSTAVWIKFNLLSDNTEGGTL
ncbi:MAG: asparagine synthase (glutamine-hydrolyzing), partial [Candidatus Omnitrophota bacterium]